jgi:hypothetical protein
MKWWNEECYICYRSFNSTSVPRMLAYGCRHELCEDCLKKIQTLDYKKTCFVCKSTQKIDITYRIKKNKKTQDIFQQVLLANEFPHKIKLKEKKGFLGIITSIFNKK